MKRRAKDEHSSKGQRVVNKAKRGGTTVAATSSLSDRAGQLASGGLPSNYVSAAPAIGARPDLGPLPVATDAGQRFEPVRSQLPYGWNAYWTPRRNALTPFAIL